MKLTHIAYCTGPAQLVYLLGSLEVCDVSLDSLTMQPAGLPGVRNAVVQVSKHMGIKVVDPALLPTHSVMRVMMHRFRAKRANQVAYWYCRGGIPTAPAVMRNLRKNMPDVVFEYYDGLRSPIVARKLRSGFRHMIGQLVKEKLLKPDRYFIQEDSLWRQYASIIVQARTSYIPIDVIRRKIKLVGGILDDLNRPQSYLGDSPGVVLITGRFAEYGLDISLADEIRMYEDILQTVRSVSRKVPILTKTHPRSSLEKMSCLETICAGYNAQLYAEQQLIEFILEESRQRDVVAIGPPSTALLNTLSFSYGTALVLSQQFIASYLGDMYNNDWWFAQDHELMTAAGVTTLNSLPQLVQLLQEQKIGC